MKTPLFAALAAALLTATTAFAAPTNDDHGRRADNYGYDRNHHVTREEIARYEAQHRPAPSRPDGHFDRNQNYGFDRSHQVTRDERYRWELAHNYGYDARHRVTPQERARWEAQYRR